MKEKTPSYIYSIKDAIQDCHINFLIGSGLSTPFLSTLGNIEILLTNLQNSSTYSPDQKKLMKSIIYRCYFDNVILKNLDVLNNDDNDEITKTKNNYARFLKLINAIITKRKNNIVNKQVNLFTTNIDIFLDIALEESQVEYNDGFSGRFKPRYSINNFNKQINKTSFLQDSISEIPTFNLYKIHGSLNWNLISQNIHYSSNLELIDSIIKLPFPDKYKYKELPSLEKIARNLPDNSDKSLMDDFIKNYEKLQIVNPTKEKFSETVFNEIYYDQIRIYANSLEKINTILFCLGFSFADEHLKDITLRAANSNPTLIIYIFAFDDASEKDIKRNLVTEEFKYNNIRIIKPLKEDNNGSSFSFDFNNINKKIFENIVNLIQK